MGTRRRTRRGTETVKVGDPIDVDGNGFVQLPDGSAVSARNRYTIRHEGLHVVDGVRYLAEK